MFMAALLPFQTNFLAKWRNTRPSAKTWTEPSRSWLGSKSFSHLWNRRKRRCCSRNEDEKLPVFVLLMPTFKQCRIPVGDTKINKFIVRPIWKIEKSPPYYLVTSFLKLLVKFIFCVNWIDGLNSLRIFEISKRISNVLHTVYALQINGEKLHTYLVIQTRFSPSVGEVFAAIYFWKVRFEIFYKFSSLQLRFADLIFHSLLLCTWFQLIREHIVFCLVQDWLFSSLFQIPQESVSLHRKCSLLLCIGLSL